MKDKKTNQNLIGLLKPYKRYILLLIFLALVSNGMNLWLPKIIASALDSFVSNSFSLKNTLTQFTVLAFAVAILTFFQNIVQVIASEKVAKDLRSRLINKISGQSYEQIQNETPAKILTNLTADVDSIKFFISQAIVSLFSSVFIIIGAGSLLLYTNWKLALVMLTILPLIAISFFLVFSKVKTLFIKAREAIDKLNRVINENILGASLIRVLNSQQIEYSKFLDANTEAKGIGLNILKLFASLIPLITFLSNLGTLAIFTLGGKFVIDGSMTLGDFAAFNSYLSILIFPIFIIGFSSNVIAQASASFERIEATLNSQDQAKEGTLDLELNGDLELSGVSVKYNDKAVLKDVSIKIKGGSKTAIIGPTAAGKSQLLYLLIALTKPDLGQIKLDNKLINAYKKDCLHRQIGLVFQESIIFNLTLRENIAFNSEVSEENLAKAITTAELQDLVDSMPEGLETVVSERGSSLSGGQKQRIMLARALALNPKVLLLDDFTARVDAKTEQKILENLTANYPGLTLVSVTQKISTAKNFDQVILLMEGEVLANGSHMDLLDRSPEYVQIYNSQKSTSNYEQLQA